MQNSIPSQSLPLSDAEEDRQWAELEEKYTDRAERITLYTIRKTAEKFDIPFRAAVKMRMRYLHGHLEDNCAPSCEECEPLFGLYPCSDDLHIILELKHLRQSLIEKPHTNGVTDEQIEQANLYPIDRLIEFKHGKTHCPFHDDKSPSMFHATRKNIACCPVCDAGWGPIRLTMDRDGMTFIQAVKHLCSL
jgi:hypothetical protein